MEIYTKETGLKNISWLSKIGYGSGNLGFGIVYQVIGTYLVFYATAVLDISSSLVGAAVSAGVIWDGITDPVMGYFTDITHHRTMGRRHIYILIGCVGTFISNYLLWIVSPFVILGLMLGVIGCIAFLILVLFKDAAAGKPFYLLPYAVLVGFGTGGLFSIPISMIADTIDLEELNTGVRPEGIFYGCLTLSYKFSQSVAIFLLGILLDLVKFDSNIPVQPDSTVIILGLTLSLGSIIVFIMAILSYLRYDLNMTKVVDIQHKIKLKKGM